MIPSKRPIPKEDKDKDFSDYKSGEVITYFISGEELEYYRNLPMPNKEDRINMYYISKRQV